MMRDHNGSNPKAEWKPPPDYKSALAKARNAQELKEKKKNDSKGKKGTVSAVGQGEDNDSARRCGHTSRWTMARHGVARRPNQVLELHGSMPSTSLRVLTNSKNTSQRSCPLYPAGQTKCMSRLQRMRKPVAPRKPIRQQSGSRAGRNPRTTQSSFATTKMPTQPAISWRLCLETKKAWQRQRRS